MGTFGYLVDGYFGMGLSVAGNSSTISSTYTGNGDLRSYLIAAGLCDNDNTQYKSKNYFENEVLKKINNVDWNVTVKTRTQADLTEADVNSADLIVISETVPAKLKTSAVASKTFRTNGCKLSTQQVMWIFRKIAGVNGTDAIPYIIDFDLYDGGSFVDVRGINTLQDSTDRFGYEPADQEHILTQGGGDFQGITPGNSGETPSLGSDSTSYKLYKLLSCIDPSTLYGLYYVCADGSYGIDDDLNLLELYTNSSHLASAYNRGGKLPGWTDEYFAPNYLTTNGKSISSIKSTMGWFEADTNSSTGGNKKLKNPGTFLQTIGGKEGHGQVFNSDDGIFYVFGLSGSSGGGGVNLDDYTDISSSVEVSSYSGGQYEREINLKNTGSSSNKWKVTLKVDGLSGVNGSSTPTIYYPFNSTSTNFVTNGDYITFYASGISFGNGGTIQIKGQFTATEPISYSVGGPSGGGGSSLEGMAGIIQAFTGTKTDNHPYRYILVTGSTTTNNRSVIADMVKEANKKGLGLPNGIEVKCMSSAQYANLNVSSSEYDGVFYNSSDILDDFKNRLGKKAGVNFITLPTEYYTNFKPNFQSENGWASYFGSGDIKVAGNKNYINDDAHPNKRELDFKLKLSGATSYNVVLYVDVNGNCTYDGGESFNLGSPDADGILEQTIPLTTIFGEEAGGKYVGAFSWRLVVNGHAVYDAVSAFRNAEGKNKIKILQIYPTDYSDQYGQNWGSRYSCNPTLILPTKTEISSFGNINSYNPVTNFNTVKSYMSGKIKIDVATSLDGNDNPSAVSTDQTVNISSSEDNKRNHIIIDSSLFYYYLSKLEDYEIDVTRYSVYSFNNTNDIVYNTNTGRLGKADGDQKKNLDGSLRYGYTAAKIGKSESEIQTTEVTWTEGKLKKYLIDENNSLIYGERLSDDGKVKYYGANEYGAGTPCKGTSEENEFDILMLGFGSTMDFMKDTKVTMIKNYLENGGCAFIGNGTVTLASNNSLGKEIATVIGMNKTSSAQSGYNYVNESAIPIMVTNDTILSHYPYSVEKYMRASGASKQPYALDLSTGPVVSFVKYNSESGSNHSSWGDAEHNYYVYKKGNITFCGFGSTFPKAKIDQVGGIMTLAETLMIVNALVATSRFGSGGTVSEPYMKCIDPDRSVIGESMMEDDFEAYYFKDSIYTDYDAYDIAGFKADAATVFNTPIDSTGLKPEGFTDPTTNIRWIPYRAKLATEDGGYIEFMTTDNKTLAIQVYKYNESSKTFAKQTPVSGTTNKYSIPQKGIYYIGVPIDPSGYSGVSSSTKLGFRIDKNDGTNSIDQFAIKMLLKNGDSSTAKTVETHTIIMVRRVLYHTS
ncbi:MAG: hypothetical protein IK014_08200 [Lachnospiraceae bacterium]|nr:hypothetical protein [Lachnospiraceae bacterium]